MQHELDALEAARHHGAGDRPERDERRDAWLAAQGIVTLRLSAAPILRDVDDAVRTMRGFLEHGE